MHAFLNRCSGSLCRNTQERHCGTPGRSLSDVSRILRSFAQWLDECAVPPAVHNVPLPPRPCRHLLAGLSVTGKVAFPCGLDLLFSDGQGG